MSNYEPTHTAPMVSASQYNNQFSGNFTPNQFPQNRCCVRSAMVQPSIDISETSSDVIVSASVSNVEVEDLNLNVTDNSVTISGMAWTGREHISLNRTVALPTSVRAELIDANIQSGVLEIRCPKSERMIRQRNTINGDTIHTEQE
ncbi:MAG: Hsp20/alpha crystallin family protein [Firmicutes bacterium]|nr:Hsp20/alpha crystallin family protein [Bacillota bacterium]